MFGLDPQTSKTYCGYCKCDPCQCDGHGNFGPQENISWYPADLDTPTTDDNDDAANVEETLTNEDGTPYKPSYERQLRTDYRSPERAWRPKRPHF